MPEQSSRLAHSQPAVVDVSEFAHFTTYELRIPVADPHSERTMYCAAVLTVPAQPRSTLQILVHGATYNRWYWDPDISPAQASYVHAAAARGYATVNIDRIGSGRSEHPDGGELSLDLHAETVNTIAAQARAGLAGFSFARIVGVGHSVGTYVLMNALNGAHGLDAAVLTGISHRRTDADPIGMNIPAVDDPLFRQRNVTEYFTMPLEYRRNFYHVATVGPEVIAADGRHRDVVGVGDLRGIEALVSRPCAATVPLCVAMGGDDWLFGAADTDEFRAEESRWYPEATSLDFLVYPDVGHNINLHRSGPQAMSEFLDWVDAH